MLFKEFVLFILVYVWVLIIVCYNKRSIATHYAYCSLYHYDQYVYPNLTNTLTNDYPTDHPSSPSPTQNNSFTGIFHSIDLDSYNRTATVFPQYHGLIGSKVSDVDVQPIPPHFIPRSPMKMNRKKHAKRKGIVKHLIKRERLKANTTVPYTEEELRHALAKSSFVSTVTVNRPLRDFYQADPNWKSYRSPILMDAFSYCDGDHLIIEGIFNTKYIKKEKPWMHSQWSCYHNGTSVGNSYQKSEEHMIVTLFLFPSQCTKSSDLHYMILNESYNVSYSLDVEFLPDFTKQRFYLSACTMIEDVSFSMVRMYIHHYFFHGVQHFIFYINDLLDQWRQSLLSYIQSGLVELIDFTFPHHEPFYEQAVMLSSCARRYRYNSQFMIFNDVDEYFHPMNSTWRVIDVVHLYDRFYPNVDAFSVLNTWYTCNITFSMWERTLRYTDICNERWTGTVGFRQKNIVRLSHVVFVHVHIVTGSSVQIDSNHDMVMIHFKMRFRQNEGIPIVPNPFVYNALNRSLF